jgi:hypothetical protein
MAETTHATTESPKIPPNEHATETESTQDLPQVDLHPVVDSNIYRYESTLVGPTMLLPANSCTNTIHAGGRTQITPSVASPETTATITTSTSDRDMRTNGIIQTQSRNSHENDITPMEIMGRRIKITRMPSKFSPYTTLHTCSICDQKFKWRKDLQRHKEIKHQGIQNGDEKRAAMFRCLCGYARRRKDQVKQHTKIHEGRSSQVDHQLLV